MLTLDIILLVLLVAAAYVGWRMGLVQQIVSFVGFGLSLWMAWKFCDDLCGMVQAVCGTTEFVSKVIGFVAIALAGTILLSWMAALLTHIMDMLHIGVVNRLAGVAISMVKYGILIGCIIKMLVFVGTISDDTVKRSVLAAPLSYSATLVFSLVTADDAKQGETQSNIGHAGEAGH